MTAVLYVSGGLWAAAPLAVNDLDLTAQNASRICYPLANDTDADGDTLSLQAVDAASARGGTVANNGNGTVTYTPPAGFAGLDTFNYTVTDGSGTAVAAVSVSVNATFDAEAARTAILNGVTTLADPGGPSGCVAYGPTAYSIGHYGGENRSDPIVAAATLGLGRVLAMPDHQWLRMNSFAGSGNTATYYLNAIQWLTGTTSKTIKIVVTNVDNNDSDVWLTAQGYTNVVKTSNYAAELSNAALLVGWLGSSMSQSDVDAIVGFARNGGALFLADYGIGYIWWWTGTGIVNAPGNRVLRQAGIGFGKDGGGSLTIGRSSGQTTAENVISMLKDSSGYTATELDIGGVVMGRLFDILPAGDNLLARLDEQFRVRIGTINPTPATPLSNTFEKALINREASLLQNTPFSQVEAHRTASAVYGAIPVGAARVNRTVSIDTARTRWHSTGLYAVPGELITVTVPAAAVGRGFRVRLSGHVDDISSNSSWKRIPYGISRTADVTSTTVQIASAFGGAVYFDVGSTQPALADFDIQINGAIEAPCFVLGETTNAQWVSDIRDNPAPFAELVSDHLAISFPSQYVRTVDDMEAVMQYWDNIVAVQDYVGALESFRTNPERINIDVQISVGWLHAGYPTQGPTEASTNLANLSAQMATGDWGWFHELGHESQRRPDKAWGWDNYYTFPGDVEVTVNIFSNASLETTNNVSTDGWGYSGYPCVVMQRAIATINDAAKPNFDDKDPYPFYFQLADGFDWATYRAVFLTYHNDFANNPSALPSPGQQEKDQWLIRWSQVSGYNMVNYMVNKWKLEVSSSAISQVNAMGLPDWLPVVTSLRDVEVTAGSSYVFDIEGGVCSLDGVSDIIEIVHPTYGTLTDNGNGTWTYAAPLEVGITDTFSFTVRSSAGNTKTCPINIRIGSRKLTAYYTFDNDNLTGSTVRDMSGPERYDATNVTAKTGYTGRVEEAFYFDGDDDYLTVPAMNLNSNTVTMTAWIKRDGTQDSYAGILFSRAGSTVAGMNFRGTTHELGYHWNGSSSAYNYASGLVIPSNQWTFVAMVIEPDKATLYMNSTGKVNTVSHGIEEFDGITYIGRDYVSRSYKGLIDEVTIWNRALGSNEIADLYSRGRAMINVPPSFPAPFVGDPAREGIAYQGDLASVVTDTEDGPLTFSLISGPAWLNVASSGIVSGTPDSADIGTQTVTVSAVDELGGTSQADMSVEVHNLFRGDMGFSDFAVFAANWFRMGCADFPSCGACDLDGDNDVDSADLEVFVAHWLDGV